MVVLPAASNPTINIRISFLPKRPLNKFANTFPMVCYICSTVGHEWVRKNQMILNVRILLGWFNHTNVDVTRDSYRESCLRVRQGRESMPTKTGAVIHTQHSTHTLLPSLYISWSWYKNDNTVHTDCECLLYTTTRTTCPTRWWTLINKYTHTHTNN